MEFVVKGGDAPTPVVFGDYEIGRSRFDRGGGYLTAPFRDNMPQHRTQHEEHWRLWGNVGDPGTYDPRVTRQNLASANLAAKKFMSSSETRPAFDSTWRALSSLQIGQSESGIAQSDARRTRERDVRPM